MRRRLKQLPALLEREGVLLAYLFGSLVEGASESTGRPAPRDVDLAIQDTNYLRQQQRKILKERMAQWSSTAKESKR